MFGSIDSFSPADAVGSIRTDDGAEIRFGRSDCAFEPVVGTRVEVLGTKPGFRGALKATGVRLGESEAVHAGRLGERDQARGLRPPTLPAEELARTASLTAGLTLLLDHDLPREMGGLMAWASSLGLETHGMSVTVEGSRLVFVVRGVRVGAIFGHDPYPIEMLDCSKVPASFVTGKSSVTLVFSFMPHLYFTKDPDGWLEHGHARAMSRLAALLIERGAIGVVVHRAGELVHTAKTFRARLGNLDDPTCVPFAAWFELRKNAAGELVSTGLRAFGLPEVRVASVCEPGSWQAGRRFEAALFASYCMCRRMWVADGLFEVPRRLQVGAYPPEMIDPVDVERWDARLESAGIETPMELVLRPRGDSDDCLARWAAGTLGHGGYEALLVYGIKQLFRLDELAVGPTIERPLPFRVVTFRGYADELVMVTSGIGRAHRPGGLSMRVELMLFATPEEAMLQREFLHALGPKCATEQGFEPWRVLRTAGLGSFLLRPMGVAHVPGGPSVGLLELMPLTQAEADWAETARGVDAHFNDFRPEQSLHRWAQLLAQNPPN